MNRRSFIKLLGGAAGLVGMGLIPKPVRTLAVSAYDQLSRIMGKKIKVLVELPNGVWLDISGDVQALELTSLPMDLEQAEAEAGPATLLIDREPKAEFTITMDVTDQVWRAK